MNESLRKNLDAGITEKRVLPPLAKGQLLTDTIISIGVATIAYASHSKTSINTVDKRTCPPGPYLVLNDGTTPVSVTYRIKKGESGILRSDDVVILENRMTQKRIAFVKVEEAKPTDLSVGTPA